MSGLQRAVEGRPDLVVLDLGLPDLDGAELLRMLRAVSAVPVIVATARDDDGSIVSALDAGADDYVLKPFQAGQLEARIRAVLRRAGGGDAEPSAGAVGDLTIDPRARRGAPARPPPRPGPQGVGPPALPPPPRDPAGDPGRLPRRAGAQGVRPARLPRRPRRHGGVQARAAPRGVAAALRRLGQDRRRPPVLAAPQARRVGGRAAADPDRARRRGPPPPARALRRRITPPAAATTSV